MGVASGISMWQCALKASLPRLKIKMQRHGAAFFKDIFYQLFYFARSCLIRLSVTSIVSW